MKSEQVEKAIIKFLKDNIIAEEAEVDETTGLSELGIDSYSIVEILLFIERKYGFVVPDEYLKPENFKSVSDIAKMVIEVDSKQ